MLWSPAVESDVIGFQFRHEDTFLACVQAIEMFAKRHGCTYVAVSRKAGGILAEVKHAKKVFGSVDTRNNEYVYTLA